ncbi:MAG: endonuclease/exonuclease/phosphatase family protein [Solirubrobacteraceae bacterium MAG38_C4-C5]|nr:endonuclease/exonuclease/phosphatase family protein [Candidatus Siliceabacter maunaloa]
MAAPATSPLGAAGPEHAPDHLRVITFNTAAGNPRIKTAQRAFLELPFYREVIEGRSEAPILALQEVGSQQARALKHAAANGRFRLVHIQRPGQGNALLIPQRFQVLSRRSRYLIAGQLRGIIGALWRAARGRGRPDHRQLAELRMFNEARLRDERCGRVFTVLNTHLSAEADLRVVQAREFFGRAHAARRHGPVIVTGDLNTRTVEHPDLLQARADARVRALFAPLKDMGAAAVDPRRPKIDYVLADGFAPVSARLYTGDALQLPGLPTAEVISDHYAEEDVLRFA